MRVVVLFLLIVKLLFAAYSTESSYEVERHILKSLDLPVDFVHTERFHRFAKKYDIYKKIHLFDPNDTQTYFIPDLVRIINAHNVPDVFLYMAMAESRFATHARSNKSAVGIWQLLPQTARLLGLRIDKYVDERRDPYKSTNAAIKYLKKLHAIFGKWYLAALAYNAGPGAVKRAIQKAGTDDVFVLLDPKKRYLPKESRNYLYKIVMLALMANNREYKVSSDLAYIISRGENYDIMPVPVRPGERLKKIADLLQLRYSFLKKLNPQIKRSIVPPNQKDVSIYIPRLKYFTFQEKYIHRKKGKKGIIHTVKANETLYAIAKQYNVSIQTLQQHNGLKNSIIRVGQKIYIPK